MSAAGVIGAAMWLHGCGPHTGVRLPAETAVQSPLGYMPPHEAQQMVPIQIGPPPVPLD